MPWTSLSWATLSGTNNAMGYAEDVEQRHNDLKAIQRFRNTTLNESRTRGTCDLRLAGENLFVEAVQAVKVLEHAVIVANPHVVKSVAEGLMAIADVAASAADAELDNLERIRVQSQDAIRQAELREQSRKGGERAREYLKEM